MEWMQRDRKLKKKNDQRFKFRRAIKKNPEILTWIALPGKIHFNSLFFGYKCCCFRSTKFRFSTSNDLKTAKLPRQCTLKLKLPLLGNSCEGFDDVSPASDVDDDGCFEGNKFDFFFSEFYVKSYGPKNIIKLTKSLWGAQKWLNMGGVTSETFLLADFLAFFLAVLVCHAQESLPWNIWKCCVSHKLRNSCYYSYQRSWHINEANGSFPIVLTP